MIAESKHNKIYVVADPKDITQLAKVLTSKPKIEIINPDDYKAVNYISYAMDIVFKGVYN